jgi:hypothetical protein
MDRGAKEVCAIQINWHGVTSCPMLRVLIERSGWGRGDFATVIRNTDAAASFTLRALRISAA